MKKNIFKQFILLLFIICCKQITAQQFFIKNYTVENGLPTRMINDACQDKDGNMWFATYYGLSKYDGFSFTNYSIENGLPVKSYRKLRLDKKGVLWATPYNTNSKLIYLKNGKWYPYIDLADLKANTEISCFDIIYKNNDLIICIGTYNGLYINKNYKWLKITISDKPELNIVNSLYALDDKFYISTKIGLCVYENNKLNWELNKIINPDNKEILATKFENYKKNNEKLWILNEDKLGYFGNKDYHPAAEKLELTSLALSNFPYMEIDKFNNIFFGNNLYKYLYNTENKSIKLLTQKNGFSSKGATSLFIDKENNIWFTDTRGIDKISNTSITNYYEYNGLPENEVTAIVELENDKFILGHNNQLSIFENGNFQSIQFPEIKNNLTRVLDIIKDKDGNIWFTANNLGIGKLNKDLSIKWYNFPDNNYGTALFQEKNGKIWVGTNRKLFYLENNKLVEFKYNNLLNNNIRKIFAAPDSGIYITGMNGLWYINNKQVKQLGSEDSLINRNVFSYYKNRAGEEFVGTMNGLFHIDNGKIVKYNKYGIDIKTPIFFIFQDKKMNYWLGSNNGVYYWDGKSKISFYNPNNGLAGRETNRSAGLCDNKGRIWIGTDKGLSCFNYSFYKYKTNVPKIDLLNFEDSKGKKYPLNNKSSISYNNNTLNFHFRGLSFYNEELIEYQYKLEGLDNKWRTATQQMLDKIIYYDLKPGKYMLAVRAKNYSSEWSETAYSEFITIETAIYKTWWFILSLIAITAIIILILFRIRLQKKYNKLLVKDIEERKLIEIALKESKQSFQDLVQLLPEPIYETDIEGTIIYINEKGANLFNYDINEIVNILKITDLISEEDIENFNKHCNELITSQISVKIELLGKKKYGYTFPISINTAPKFNENKFVGCRGIIIDLSEQKKYEKNLQTLAEDLKLLNANKDKFFSIIAHDLRSPFNAFLGLTEIMAEEINTMTLDEIQRIAISMQTSAKNLFSLLENLLQWSKIQQGKYDFKPININLISIINYNIEVFDETAKLKQINITNLITDNIEIEADAPMFNSIIRNLLSNAIKFTPKGGRIIVSSEAIDNQYIKISIKDNGIGMDDSILKKLFKIDEQSNRLGTEGESSTGLGLLLCKEFVEIHEGKIHVESQEGKGSTFSFTMKIYQ